jgi:hypothetical protein
MNGSMFILGHELIFDWLLKLVSKEPIAEFYIQPMSSFGTRGWTHTYFNSQTIDTNDITNHLLGQNWLNDNIISFHFLYLEEMYGKQCKYAYLSPSMVFMIQMCECRFYKLMSSLRRTRPTRRNGPTFLRSCVYSSERLYKH